MQTPLWEFSVLFLTTTQYFLLQVASKRVVWLPVTFQGDDFTSGIHDSTVGRDWPPDWGGGVRHVHDHHLVLFSHLLSDADELVRLHGEIAEPNVGWVHAHVLQLGRLKQQYCES